MKLSRLHGSHPTRGAVRSGHSRSPACCLSEKPDPQSMSSQARSHRCSAKAPALCRSHPVRCRAGSQHRRCRQKLEKKNFVLAYAAVEFFEYRSPDEASSVQTRPAHSVGNVSVPTGGHDLSPFAVSATELLPIGTPSSLPLPFSAKISTTASAAITMTAATINHFFFLFFSAVPLCPIFFLHV